MGVKIFVLFIFIYAGSQNGGVAIQTQEFESELSCESARTTFMEIMDTGNSYPKHTVWAAWCAPKEKVVN